MTKRISFFVFLASLAASVAAATLEVYPTFENCSYYFTPDAACTVAPSWATDSLVRVRYRAAGTEEWQTAFRPVYDESRQQFRGSLFHLTEDTDYEVSVLQKNDGIWQEVQAASFRTWTGNPPVKRNLKLHLLGAYKAGQPLTLNAMRGTADEWIKVVGDVPVNAGNSADDAITITNCEYLILEGFTVTGGRINGIRIDESCRNIRIIGADISAWGRVPVDQVYLADAANYPSSKYKNYDATYLDDRKELIRNDAGICIVTSANDESRTRFNFVIERCYIHDQNGFANPWYGTRLFGTGAGTSFRFLHPQGPHAMYVRSAGSVVVRYNDFAGSDIRRLHDACGGMDNGKLLGGWYRDTDIYGNYFGFGQDDGIELDGSQMNVRMYDNRIEQYRCGVSAAPCLAGPSYIMDNVVADLGDSERDHGAAMKNGGGDTYSKGLIHYLGNTIYVAASCIATVGYGSDSNQGMFQGFTRNNMLCCTVKNSNYGGNCIHENATHPNCSYDYDFLYNSKLSGRQGVIYVQAPNSETHAVKGDPKFADIDHRVFTLTQGSPAIGAGQYLEGISIKSAPDMGAFQTGESTLYPKRPLPVEVDKYQLRIHPQGYASLTLGSSADTDLSFAVRMDNEMRQWFETDVTDSALLAAGGAATVILHAHVADSVARLPKGVLFIRFAGGWSVPVSIVADNAEQPNEKLGLDAPAQAGITLCGKQLRVETSDKALLTVYSTAGTSVLQAPVAGGVTMVDVSGLGSGVYIAIVNHMRYKFIL
ncbi:MAG: hypothetical protein IJ814_04390 [Paludibacteraceae bacterium]|nr:hypothetical protein [Paludibacteraceae bacterium]